MQPQAPPTDTPTYVSSPPPPEVARRLAEVLRRCFATREKSSYPADAEGGTRLQLTVDTTSAAEPARSWLETSRSSGKDGRRK